MRGGTLTLWKSPMDPRPIEFHQLCGIARMLLEAAPAMTDAEWREAVKAATQKQGYSYPTPEQLSRALDSVERATVKTLGPRPLAWPAMPALYTPQPLQQDDPPWSPKRRRELTHRLVGLLSNLPGSDNSERRSKTSAVPPPGELLPIDESVLLTAFWNDVNAVSDRLEVLRVYAYVGVERPPGWDVAAVRAEAERLAALAHEDAPCFACRSLDRRLVWHHVIQLQNGGSNNRRNRVSICEACHADVHPWLPKVHRLSAESNWTSLRELVAGQSAREPRPRPPAPPTQEKPMVNWAVWPDDARFGTTCGHDESHAIRPGDLYLVIEVGRSKTKRLRCLHCAITRHGMADPRLPPQPPSETENTEPDEVAI